MGRHLAQFATMCAPSLLAVGTPTSPRQPAGPGAALAHSHVGRAPARCSAERRRCASSSRRRVVVEKTGWAFVEPMGSEDLGGHVLSWPYPYVADNIIYISRSSLFALRSGQEGQASSVVMIMHL